MGVRNRKKPVQAVVNIVTGSRAIDGTIYQNTSGRPKIVIVSITQGSTPAAGSTTARAFTENVTPPTVEAARVNAGFQAGDYMVSGCLVFMVPNGDYYYVNHTDVMDGYSTLGIWAEITL